MRLSEFKQRVEAEFGPNLQNATPANVREFLDKLQQEALVLPRLLLEFVEKLAHIRGRGVLQFWSELGFHSLLEFTQSHGRTSKKIVPCPRLFGCSNQALQGRRAAEAVIAGQV